MKVALLRVGIDTGSGGALGPVFGDNSFEFIPIPDESGVDERTYGNTVGRSGRALVEFLPVRMQARMAPKAMHVDPEFETFTYGDPTSPKAGLRRLDPGDILAFYAGLQGWNCDVPSGLFLVGYFVVELAGCAHEMSKSDIRSLFAGNFQLRHRSVFESQRGKLVLVKGGTHSRLLNRAVRISSPADSPPGHYVLSTAMRKHFGNLGGKPDITRSPTRWIKPDHVFHARDFLLSLR
jgi:hypothetical protein